MFYQEKRLDEKEIWCREFYNNINVNILVKKNNQSPFRSRFHYIKKFRKQKIPVNITLLEM